MLIAGDFQPLTRATVEAAREVLNDTDFLDVLVRPKSCRTPEAPFSFEEIKQMWKAAFPDVGHIYVEQSDAQLPIIGAPHVDWPAKGSFYESDSEQLARLGLACTRPYYVSLINYHVGCKIAEFSDDWKKVLGFSWI